jgi:hypothetical protein
MKNIGREASIPASTSYLFSKNSSAVVAQGSKPSAVPNIDALPAKYANPIVNEDSILESNSRKPHSNTANTTTAQTPHHSNTTR